MLRTEGGTMRCYLAAAFTRRDEIDDVEDEG